MTRGREGRATLPALALCVILTGCAGVDGQPASGALENPREFAIQISERLLSSGYEADALLLEDGALAEDEYYESAYRFQSCAAATGVQLTGPYVNPVDGVSLLWAYAGDAGGGAEAAAAFSACEEPWIEVTALYPELNGKAMDRGLAKLVASCMTGEGFDVEGSEATFADYAGPLADGGVLTTRGSAAEQCTRTSMARLFPDVPLVVITY